MLDGQLVGESHTGFLVPKASLSAIQQALVNAEKADREELYKLEAAKKKTTVDEVALGYYLAASSTSARAPGWSATTSRPAAGNGFSGTGESAHQPPSNHPPAESG